MTYIRLYEAQDKVEWSAKAAAHLNLSEAQRLADAAAEWLRAEGFYLPRRPRVTMTYGGGSRAFPYSGEIRFGSDRPFRWILLHEVAHLVSLKKADLPGWDGDEDLRSHGRAFAAVFLKLVGHYCGTADRRALAASLRTEGVKYAPKRRREMTPEAKAAAVARLNAARPAPSPHRYAFVLRDRPDKLIGGAHLARRRGRVTSISISTDDPRATGPIYASSASGDFVVFRNDGPGHGENRSGTVDPERALTRITTEALERWAERDRWFARSQWDIVDIADILATIETERAQATARTVYVNALRQYVTEAARTVDPDRLEAAPTEDGSA